jgi:hypothetical protein
MTVKELFEKYPEAANAIVKNYSETFVKSIENTDTPEEFKQFARQQQIDHEYVIEFIESNPRGTFDFFDSNDIYIQTIVYPDKTFTCSVNELGTINSFPTRKEAETYAIEAAFQILNEKLCQTK